ncbi:hypothetical protein FRX31_004557 [Thalictrum thalictroides]|uniref:RING-type domain-containing protein n=1 Tax=Thalictrum thalictroides TaxID=46969 RepID=A0A7J6XA93_THATH|nr:hypothetical protein FRX31_004557 [Thalictrum thalictroides]
MVVAVVCSIGASLVLGILFVMIGRAMNWLNDYMYSKSQASSSLVEMVQNKIKDLEFDLRIPEDLPFGTEDCSICQHALDQGQRLLVLPSCHHVYHTDCILPIILQRSLCPVCRRCISLEEGVATDENEVDVVV